MTSGNKKLTIERMDTLPETRPAGRSKTRAAAITLAIAAALVALGIFILSQKPAAPDAKFITLDGEAIHTKDLRGKVVLVNFWATSCTVCMHEMPKLIETHNKFAPRGYQTIAVAMSYDPPNYVLDYTKRQALPFRVALDQLGELARQFGDVRVTPTSFLIDKQGRIVRQLQGEPDFAQLDKLIDELLREPT